MAQAQSRDGLRILLVGKTGAGKSCTGNSLLGRNAFTTTISLSSTTKECAKETSNQGGREITVLDTPGFFDTNKKPFTQKDVQAWIQLLHPGPHAILLVVKLGTMTKEEKESIQLAKKLFSGGKHFLILLFTHRDYLDHDGLTLATFLEKADEDFKELKAAAGNRCFAINNHAQGAEKEQQVAELMEMIDSLARNTSFYSEEMFESIRKMENLEQEKEDLEKEVEKWKQLAKENEKPRKQSGGCILI